MKVRCKTLTYPYLIYNNDDVISWSLDFLRTTCNFVAFDAVWLHSFSNFIARPTRLSAKSKPRLSQYVLPNTNFEDMVEIFLPTLAPLIVAPCFITKNHFFLIF
jgi:hypothetical protein